MSERCRCCNQRIPIGQIQLTDREKERYDWAGANQSPNIIDAQCAKASAAYFGVDDWTAYWDPELSIDENHEIMRRQSTAGVGGQTMRELSAEYR